MKKEEDENLFELDDLEETDLESHSEEEDPLAGSANSLTEIAEGSSNKVATAGFVALLGLLGWFFASRLQKNKGAADVGGKNFKPVDFGF